ncbi:MAG: hypothetical protein HY666_04500 [Chloroflexi bacterium]|nr:hypothetical protein [Chloroflexota bacterium]
MVKKLRFSKIDLVERVGALMLVTFLDDTGDMYQWAPKWADVEQIFLKQINIERYNKPESEWLNKFAKTAQNVVEGAQRIESAFKVSGRFQAIRDQKLIFEVERGELKGYEYDLIPGFEVTLDFLDNWLNNYVEALVVNDIIIRLRTYDNDGEVEREYPQPEPADMPW